MDWRGIALKAARAGLRSALSQTSTRGRGRRTSGSARTHPRVRTQRLTYSPHLDGRADPGEVVWTWVTYEEDPSRGKDRPVVVMGRDGDTLLGLMLSSNSAREGQRHWLGLGAGPWDGEDRESWVRLDRVLELTETGIRREGAVLDRRRFDRIAAALRRDYGWDG